MIYAILTRRARADKLFKKQIDVSLSCVFPVSDNDFRHNIVKSADPLGYLQLLKFDVIVLNVRSTKPKDRHMWELQSVFFGNLQRTFFVKLEGENIVYLFTRLPLLSFVFMLCDDEFLFSWLENYFVIVFTIPEVVSSFIMSWISMVFGMISVFIRQSARFIVPYVQAAKPAGNLWYVLQIT